MSKFTYIRPRLPPFILIICLVLGLTFIFTQVYRKITEVNHPVVQQPPTENIVSTSHTLPSQITHTPSEIPTLKLYTSKHFELKYPSSWEIVNQSDAMLMIEGDDVYFNIDIGTTGIGVSDFDSYQETSLTIDSIKTKAKEYTWNSGGKVYEKVFEVNFKSTRYGFRLIIGKNANLEEAKQLQQKIINTFRFLI